MKNGRKAERYREKIEELVLPSEVDGIMRSTQEIANDLGLDVSVMFPRVEEYLNKGYSSDEAVVKAGLDLFDQTLQ